MNSPRWYALQDGSEINCEVFPFDRVRFPRRGFRGDHSLRVHTTRGEQQRHTTSEICFLSMGANPIKEIVSSIETVLFERAATEGRPYS